MAAIRQNRRQRRTIEQAKRGPKSSRETSRVGNWLARLLPWTAVALALAVFAGVQSYPFVDDDKLMVVNNPELRSWSSVPHYFVEDAWGHSGQDAKSNYYRPAQLLWLRLNYAWFDLEPGGYHVTAMVLHALATALVFLVARRSLKDRVAAGFAALIFAVHPIHVEPAVWISGATESELAVFFLSAILGYLAWRSDSPPRAALPSEARSGVNERRNRLWLALSIIAYALALLTKESAILLGLVFVIYEWKRQERSNEANQAAEGTSPDLRHSGAKAPHSRTIIHRAQEQPRAAALRAQCSHGLAAIALQSRRVFLALWPYGALVAVYLGARAYALRLSPQSGSGASPATILFTLPEVFAFDLRKLLWPLPLSLFYPLQIVARPRLGNFVLPLAVSAAALAALWFWSRRSEAAGWASVWLLIPLATPLFGISRFLADDLVHDRFLYLPSAGLAMLAGVALRRLKSGRKVGGVPLAQLAVALAIVCLMATLTVSHTRQWSGEVALYQQAVKVAPHSRPALNQLAMAELRDDRDLAAAASIQERALAEAPNDFTTLVHTGIMRRNVQDFDGALPVLLHARQLQPEKRDPHYYLGLVYLDKEQYADAEAELRQAIRLAPQRPEQHALLGFVLEKQGRPAEARSEYQAELQINPNSTKARQALAALSR